MLLTKGVHFEMIPAGAIRLRPLQVIVHTPANRDYITMMDSDNSACQTDNNDLAKIQLQELKLFWENFLQCTNDNIKVSTDVICSKKALVINGYCEIV